MEKVAARARVSKATLYRRYKSRRELVRDALKSIRTGAPIPDTGSFRGDLLALSRRETLASARLGDPARLAQKLVGDASDDRELQKLIQQTVFAIDRRMLNEIVRRGIARGELRADLEVEIAIDLLHGPLLYRLLFSGKGLDALQPRYIRNLLDALMAGLGAAEVGKGRRRAQKPRGRTSRK